MSDVLPDGFRFEADAVAIGASAGGIDALIALFTGLPPDFVVPILTVLHLPEDHESRLAHVLAARLELPVREALPGEPVAGGCIYFAAPGYHLLVEADRTFSFSCDPPVCFSRPSIDVLMETCADAYGDRLVGLILTGANEDGARGLAAIRAAGGLTAVQDPEEAQHPHMPAAALRLAQPHYCLPLPGLRRLLHTVVARP